MPPRMITHTNTQHTHTHPHTHTHTPHTHTHTHTNTHFKLSFTLVGPLLHTTADKSAGKYKYHPWRARLLSFKIFPMKNVHRISFHAL